MINASTIDEALDLLGQLKFFPANPGTQAEIGRAIGGMCETDEQVLWLARRAIAVFNEWPGPVELRALFCHRYKPRDGQETYSAAFPEGSYPPDPTAPVLEIAAAPDRKRLTAAETTADSEMQQAVTRVATVARPMSYTRADLEAIRHLYSEEEYDAALRRLQSRRRA